jgi:hypothetical protein
VHYALGQRAVADLKRKSVEYQHGDNAVRYRRDHVRSEPWTQRSRSRVLVGTDAVDHPDRGVVQTRYRNRLGGSLGSHQAPFLSGLLAGATGLLVKLTLGGRLPPMLYLMVGLGLVLGIYAWVLLIVMRQKQVYRDVLSQLFHGLRPAREKRQIGHELDRSVTNRKT